MLQKDKNTLQDFPGATELEWLQTNGLGGWAGSSLTGTNTRRYHGLLVAATVPPTERMALVSKMDETIVVNDERYELGANLYRGDVIYPNGYQYLQSFSQSLFPVWRYEAGGVVLQKTITMVHGENTTLVVYDVLEAPDNAVLELQPFLSVRDYHALMHANDAIHREGIFANNTLQVTAYNGTPAIFINVPGSHYYPQPDWYLHFNYAVERYRGLDFEEDLFTPGHFSVPIKKGDSIGIMISTIDPAGRNAQALLAAETNRKKSLLHDQPADETIQQLVLAADQFIVKRGEDLKTVIAGYHWFTDWGRDTMISLPGLTLSTGRYDDAKKILAAFANSVSMGMLPNRFQDNGEAPEYNNVDGTLWYFIAVYKYWKETGDNEFISESILPVLKEIIDWHFKGTRYNIHVSDDGLLYAGETGQQLTWMDARIGTWVVTPRMGKPVEIQALWYNALMIFAELLELNDQLQDASLVRNSAAKARESFSSLFWNGEANCLYDVIDENGIPELSLRPNQLFAISLPFALVDMEQAKAIFSAVSKQLYTPVGLRSLPPSDIHYIPVYGGDAWHRDSSYHEGTAWSWLLGAYVDAMVKIESSRENLVKVVDAFRYHLGEGCMGTVSEIFDAAAPHHPRGCVAQAWGVAEVLRVMKEYKLYNTAEQRLEVKNKTATKVDEG